MAFQETVDALKQKFAELAENYKQIRAEKVAQIQQSGASALKLSGSVGKGGDNQKADVLLVQKLLNKKGAKLSEDGAIGNNTINAIIQFQRAVFPGWGGDGLISPGKDTWKKLVASNSTPENTNNNSNNTSNNNTHPTNNNTNPPTEDTGSYGYYSHPKWQDYKYTLSQGRTSKPLNATADRLLRSIFAEANIKNGRVTSTFRDYADQAYCILTQVSEQEALGWYSYVSNNKAVYFKYKKMLATTDKETVFKEYGAWLEKNVGLKASNHLSGIAIDVAGCDLTAFNKAANAIKAKSGSSGIRKVFPEPGRTHIEFNFKVCATGGTGTGGTGEGVEPNKDGNAPKVDAALVERLTKALAGNGTIQNQVKEGCNAPNDVMVIKALLTKWGYFNFQFKAETLAAEIATLGKAGADLTAAIKKFQSEKMGTANPDGIVDVGGGTLKGLNGQLPQIQTTGSWVADRFGNEIFIEGGVSNLIVSIPKGATGALHAVVLFGGTPSSKYGAHFMKGQVEASAADFFGKVIVITSKYENGFTKSVYDAILKQKGVTMASYSVAGFSAGGPAAFAAAGGAKGLGLMDPAMNAGHVKNYGNGKMIYNPRNWQKNYPKIADYLKQLGALMGSNAVDTGSASYDHDGIPGAFLAKFKGHLL